MDDIYASRFSSWTPPSENIYESPAISFTDAMFRRRLSQLSKMTIQVVHDLLPVEQGTKLFFLSFRGEITKQFSVNRMVIEENTASPAAFSFSVFNTPIALASMAFGLKGGYSVIFPGNDSFITGLKTAQAALLSGTENELVFVYADEAVPKEFAGIALEDSSPFAFAILLKRNNEPGFVPLSLIKKSGKDSAKSFLNQLLSYRDIYVSV